MFGELPPPPPIVTEMPDLEQMNRIRPAEVQAGQSESERVVTDFNAIMDEIEADSPVIESLRKLQRVLPDNDLTYLELVVQGTGSANTIVGQVSESDSQVFEIGRSTAGVMDTLE